MQAGTELARRYVLEELLGHGAMGRVWRATDQVLDRPVAVKVINEGHANRELASRLKREARIAARLQHPGITAVHDVGSYDGQPFIVMELLQGHDLASILEQAPNGLPVDTVISLAIQAAEAVQAAHDGHVIHRDLKPANLFLQDSGHLKICDFGIAWAAEATAGLTAVGQAIGTVHYMSPEQCEGKRVDERSDLYSLGCVLHELLTGQPPYSGLPMAIMLQHLNSSPSSPRALRPDIPEELDRLVLDLLAKDPAARPPSASRVGAALTTAQNRAPASSGHVPRSPVTSSRRGADVNRAPASPGHVPRPPVTSLRRGADVETETTLSFGDAIDGATVALRLTGEGPCPTCHGNGAKAGTVPRMCPSCRGTGESNRNRGFFGRPEPCKECRGRGLVVDDPCPACSGRGRAMRTIQARIPAGVADGQRIKLAGKGAPGERGGPAGDLYVRVHVKPHPVFGRSGSDLTVTVPVSFAELSLGAEIKVPSHRGAPLTVRIPPGTPNGRTFRVPGKGVRREYGTVGSLLITLEVMLPKDLNSKERSAEELREAAADQAQRE